MRGEEEAAVTNGTGSALNALVVDAVAGGQVGRGAVAVDLAGCRLKRFTSLRVHVERHVTSEKT